MRNVMMTMAMLGVVGLAGSAALAQGGPGAGGGKQGAGMRGGAGPFAQLDLTAEQKAKIEEIMKAAHEKVSAAQTPEAKREIRQAAMEDVKKNVLTEAQRTKLASLAEARRGLGGGMPLGQLGLTAEQKTKAEAIMKAAREKAQAAEGRPAKMEIMKAAREDVSKNVLTEEQRAKLASLAEARRGLGGGMPLGQLDLTAEQKTKVEAIMKAAREKAQAAEGRPAKMEIMKAAREDVVKNVLTEEQRKKLESLPRPKRGDAGATAPAPK